MDLGASELRSKLIDADAARRRALVRLSQLEKETLRLQQRCEELERRSASSSSPTTTQDFFPRLVEFASGSSSYKSIAVGAVSGSTHSQQHQETSSSTVARRVAHRVLASLVSLTGSMPSGRRPI